MRSREEQRQQNIPQGNSWQREAVKPSGYAGAPSSSSAQLDLSSGEGQYATSAWHPPKHIANGWTNGFAEDNACVCGNNGSCRKPDSGTYAL